MRSVYIFVLIALIALASCRTSHPTAEGWTETGAQETDSTFISCNRTISVMSETEFVVTLTILSSQLDGMAEINEYIPDGCKAQSIDSESGLFDFNENTVQIVWVDYPEKDELKISYLVTVDSTVVGLQDIWGEMEIMDHSCQIPAVALEFDQYSIMVQDAEDPHVYGWDDFTEQREMIMGNWMLTKVKGDKTVKYEDELYKINFRNDNKITFNTNANQCTAKYSLNSDENMTISGSTCTEICCDEDPLTFPYGLEQVTYYHVTKNKLVLKSTDWQYEFERY